MDCLHQANSQSRMPSHNLCLTDLVKAGNALLLGAAHKSGIPIFLHQLNGEMVRKDPYETIAMVPFESARLGPSCIGLFKYSGGSPEEAPREKIYQILVTEGCRGFLLSSKGKRPVRSWKHMMPALHTSAAGPTLELKTSGA